MAISEAFSGSATIGGTEYDLPSASTTLSAQTADGIVQAYLDLSGLVAGDEYRLRVYEQTRAGDTQRIVDEVILSGVQTEPIYVTPALLFMHGWTFTLRKNFGTDRAIAWSIRTVG